jgi:hypothetical protein
MERLSAIVVVSVLCPVGLDEGLDRTVIAWSAPRAGC